MNTKWVLRGVLAVAVIAIMVGIGGDDAVTPDADGTAAAFQTLPSGLKIQDRKVGEGPAAKEGDMVAVHYVGTLIDGTEFDRSKPESPIEFAIGAGQLIPGFDEGIRGMKVRGIRSLEIPPELGYGKDGAGSIPPNATLRFEVELVRINEK